MKLWKHVKVILSRKLALNDNKKCHPLITSISQKSLQLHDLLEKACNYCTVMSMKSITMQTSKSKSNQCVCSYLLPIRLRSVSCLSSINLFHLDLEKKKKNDFCYIFRCLPEMLSTTLGFGRFHFSYKFKNSLVISNSF